MPSEFSCTEIETSGNEHSDMADMSDWEKASLSKFSGKSAVSHRAGPPAARLSSVPEMGPKQDQDMGMGDEGAGQEKEMQLGDPSTMATRDDPQIPSDSAKDSSDADASREGSLEFKPTRSMEEAVMGPDSDDVRAAHMAKLREMVSTLNALDARIKDVLGTTPQQSPRGSAASGQVPSSLERDFLPNWAADDEEEEEEEEDLERPANLPEQPSDATENQAQASVAGEEVTRLLDLMSEQQSFLQKLLDETAQRQAEADQQRMVDSLLETIMSGNQTESLRVIGTVRPQDLRDAKDLAGMTCLHHAVRVGDRDVICALLQKVPELANVATNIRRNPPGWTPLMIIADNAPADTDLYVVGLLCASMTADGFNTRSGTYATATHMAVARGNLPVVKKILWRMDEIGSKSLVVSHMKMQNQMARS